VPYPNPKLTDFNQSIEWLNNLYERAIQLNQRYITYLLVAMQAVGILGFLSPVTAPFFKLIVPFHLISFLAFLMMSIKGTSINQRITLLIVALVALGVEIIGVNTGLIFGEYEYGNVLGAKLFNTPILIGANWLILLVSVIGMLQKRGISQKWLVIILASSILTLLDVLIEPVAIHLGFWQWQQESVPMQNYFGWFITALLLSCCIVIQDIKFQNSLAEVTFWLEAVFFVIIYIRLLIS